MRGSEPRGHGRGVTGQGQRPTSINLGAWAWCNRSGAATYFHKPREHGRGVTGQGQRPTSINLGSMGVV